MVEKQPYVEECLLGVVAPALLVTEKVDNSAKLFRDLFPCHTFSWTAKSVTNSKAEKASLNFLCASDHQRSSLD
jgi:hypothetical protein